MNYAKPDNNDSDDDNEPYSEPQPYMSIVEEETPAVTQKQKKNNLRNTPSYSVPGGLRPQPSKETLNSDLDEVAD